MLICACPVALVEQSIVRMQPEGLGISYRATCPACGHIWMLDEVIYRQAGIWVVPSQPAGVRADRGLVS